MEKCSGEATANNRKGKLIFFYEWELILKWKGSYLNQKTTYTGKISIPNLSEENELKDIEITVTIDESNDVSENLKLFMYNVGRDKIRELLGVYITELKEEYSKNLILPKKDEVGTIKCEKDVRLKQLNSLEQPKCEITPVPSLGCKLDVRTISIEEEFQCCANDLYNVLTKESMVTAFTKTSAKIDANRGGE